MNCAECGHENRAGRKFCAECGAGLALACGTCGAPYEAGEKFCGECGASLVVAKRAPAVSADTTRAAKSSPLTRTSADGGARKIVTIVFADLVGSTTLHERLDAESAQRVMERYYDALRTAVEAHDGTVVKLLGDGVMAAFGLRQVAEDDALRAVHAAVAMQEAFRELASAQSSLAGAGLRVAVNTGEVVVSGALDDVIGDPVNVAARLQEQARDGDVVVGEATRRLVAARVTLAPLGSVTLKGRAEAVGAYRVDSLDAPAATSAAPFVGRDEELTRLGVVYDAAVAAPAARLAVLLGSPGLGKSRLIDELGRRLGASVTLLLAHCDAAGGATFAPLATALRVLLGIDDAAGPEAMRAGVESVLASDDGADRERIAGGVAALLAGSPAAPEETFFVVRRLLASLAREKSVVLVIDDIHWAEPLLLDLVEHLIQWGSGVPLFVLVGARPELRDLRSSLVVPGGLVSDVITLGGLDAGAAMRLAANVIGASDLPAAVAAKVLATSEGNPLFVGELVRMLVEEGALTKEGERWTAGAGLAAIEMPPTIHALLAARIERLRPDERTVLERASVVGRHFSRSAVAALLGKNGSELDARLEALRRSELIERDPGWLLGEPALRFHHVLIRDAAYRRLLKGTRAELHERLADWIEGQVGDAPEHDETIGWHLEQAHQHLRELGGLDARGRSLGERAAKRLAAAGRRALARDDVPLAAGLLGRAIDRLDAADVTRADLALDWCEALLSAGDVVPAAGAISELERFAESSERIRGWHTCFAGQLAVMTAPEDLHAAAERVAAAAGDLAKLGDAAGEAKAHFVHAQALARLGKVGACEAALDQALAAARRAGDRRRANAVLAGAPLAALWGPSPVTRASGRCLDVVRVLRITQGAPAVEAVALSCQGVLEALRGRTDAARRMLTSSRTMVEELGITQRLFEVDVFIGRVDLLEGNAAAAERALRPAYEGFRDLGLGIDAARAAALLGRALLEQNRAAEAEQISHESELLAGDDLEAAIAWRGVRAEALAARGEHATAIELAKAAVDIAAATDALLHHAAARVALAAALRAAGRTSEANAESQRAKELWEAKGATLLVERAGRVAAPIVDAAPVESAQAPTPSAQLSPRRVRLNAATAAVERDMAGITEDGTVLTARFNDAFEEIDHPTGSTYGRDAAVASIARLIRSRDVRYRTEPLATLGPRLMLGRRRIRASGTKGQRFDVGEYENEALSVHEVDAEGRHLRHEVFAADQLTEAICCLYARYAESLPEGPERDQAQAVAPTIFAFGKMSDLDALAARHDPNIEIIDHRRLGTWSARGAEAVREQFRSLNDVAAGIVIVDQEVLVLEQRALLCRRIHSGIERMGGGVYERAFLALLLFGPDGRLTRLEFFDPDREAEALARFDDLTAGGACATAATVGRARRIAANAATERAAEFERIVDDRDFGALESYFADGAVCIDHPTGTTYGAEGMRMGMRRLMQSPDARLRCIPLATLGPSWAIIRREMSASGATSGRFDVGPYEIVDVSVFGAVGSGRLSHVEIFTPDRLRAAVTRLYECYAQSLPEGPARKRASEIATTIAVGAESLDHLDRPDHGGLRFAASAVVVDHRTLSAWSARGREEIAAQWRAQQSLAGDLTVRDDEILALGPTAIAVRNTWRGVLCEGGGVFENVVICVIGYDADGLVARMDIFDSDREAEALARFDELSPGDPLAEPSRTGRRIRPNSASAVAARFEAAIATRDEIVLASMFSDALAVVDHQNGATYGREGQLESLSRLLRMRDATLRVEPLATLGDSLLLWRRHIHASGTAGGRFDVGEYEREELVIFEVDEDRRVCAIEIFRADRLRQAISRLNERYGERLPKGPERRRAVGVARSLMTTAFERIANRYVPSFVCVDHRNLATWSVSNREDMLTHWRAQTELSDFMLRDDDVLALDPAVLALYQVAFGTSRESGGTFENAVIVIFAFDVEGLISRGEIFEPQQAAEALARFDALTADSARSTPRTARRPVRENAATKLTRAIEAAFDRRDLDAVVALLGDPLETIEHPTGVTYGREGQIESSRRMMRLPDIKWRGETLATLGESLVLFRRIVTASGASGGRVDVGAYELESYVLSEVDETGKLRRSEVFASDHLCQAVERLYARYAETLPEGPERVRLEGIARSHSVWDGSPASEVVAGTVAPNYVCVDHRPLGTWSCKGREGLLVHWRGQLELATSFSRRDDDILAFAPGANVVRQTYYGSSRASGGPFENVFISVNVFDADGLAERLEIFEPDQQVEALARFDELAGGTTPVVARRRVRANAASLSLERFRHALAARDGDTVAATFDESVEVVHHPTAAVYGRRQLLTTWRSILKAAHCEFRGETLATLGDTLALDRHTIVVEGFTEPHLADVGRMEHEELTVIETDGAGRWLRVELFAAEHLDDAMIRLYEIHAERLPEGPARDRGTAAVRARATHWRSAATDPDRFITSLAPAIVAVDHRTVGFGNLSGAEAVCAAVRTILDLAHDVTWRIDDLLALSEHASLLRATQRGHLRSGGGEWERPICSLTVHDEQGLISRWEIFEPEREAEALARYDELVGTVTPRATPAEHPFANAGSRLGGRLSEHWHARDWDGFAATLHPRFRFEDRRAMSRIELDRDEYVAFCRQFGDMDSRRLDSEPLATRGKHLSLTRLRLDVAGGDVGPSDLAYLYVHQTDDRGERFVAAVAFDIADLEAAYAELDLRWRATVSTMRAPVMAFLDAFSAALASRDWDSLTALFAPTLVARDHRLVSWDLLEGPVGYVRALQAMAELAPDATARLDHIRIADRAFIAELAWLGTRDGGAFESPFIWVVELDAEGRGQHLDFYDPHRADRALARFEELCASTSTRSPALATPNAASAAMDRWQAAFDVGLESDDWDAMRAVCAPGMTFDDRRRLALLSGDVDLMIASARERARMGAKPERRLRGALGARVVIENMLWSGGPADGRFEIEYVGVVEVDAAGLVTAMVMFDLDDLGAAKREACARWTAIDPAAPAALARFEELRLDPLRIPPNAATRTWDRWYAAFAAGDHEAMRMLYSPDHHFDDRRRLVRTTVDLEGALLTERFLTEGGWRAERTVLATLGDRLVLQHVIWRTGESGAESEVETLEINEVDHDGRHVRHLLFDPDDRAAASAEMFERYAASGDGPAQVAIEAIRAWNDHDLGRLRALIPADFYLDDHRRTGVGRLEGADAYLASIAAVWGLSHDLRVETLYLIAVEPHGTLYVCRWFGTNTEGGEFDAVYICLALARGDRPIGLEIFELDDLEDARVRFEAFGEIGST